MLELEVLVRELVSIDGLAAGSIASREVPTLFAASACSKHTLEKQRDMRVATGVAGHFVSHCKPYLAHELRDDTCAPSTISSLHSQGSWQELDSTSTSKNSRWNLLPLKPKPFSPAYRQHQKLQLHTCRHKLVPRMNLRTCSKRSEVLGSLWHILACRSQNLACTLAE